MRGKQRGKANTDGEMQTGTLRKCKTKENIMDDELISNFESEGHASCWYFTSLFLK
jgi:hypothetical protein